MAKKIDTKSLINVELNKLEAKIKEFQDYLILNPIITKVTVDGQFILNEESQAILHKEIVTQIKIQDAIFNWMPLLEKLRETENSKPLETRGDVEVNGLFNRRRKDKDIDE